MKKGLEMKPKTIHWENGKNNDYSIILDHYSSTKINSIKTSSIPLAQDWKKTSRRLDEIERNTVIGFSNPSVFFEYPTKSYARNPSSMSDIMVIDKNTKVAIEGKFTEYDHSEYQSVGVWLEEKNRSDNRKKVLDHWLKMMGTFANPDKSRIEEVPMQFLHRTASACFESQGSACVIYQVYWDKDSRKFDQFHTELTNAVDVLQPKSALHIYLNKIEVLDIADVTLDEVFIEMKNREIYTFGSREWESLT